MVGPDPGGPDSLLPHHQLAKKVESEGGFRGGGKTKSGARSPNSGLSQNHFV